MPQTTLILSQADEGPWKRVLDDGTVLSDLPGTPLEPQSGGSGFGVLGDGKYVYQGQHHLHYLDENLVEILSSGDVVPPIYVDIAGPGVGPFNIYIFGGANFGLNKINPVTMVATANWPEALFAAGGFSTYPPGVEGNIGFGACCLSLDETIIYFTATQKGLSFENFGIVHRFDLVNNVFLSDLVSEPVTSPLGPYASTGLLTLPNGDIIVGWAAGSGHAIRRYAPDGTLVMTYTGYNTYDGGSMGWHLAIGVNNSFWVHAFPPDAFVEIDYDTGAVLKTLLVADLEAQAPGTNWWLAFTAWAPTPVVPPSGGCEGEVNTRFGGRRVGKSSRVQEEWYCCMRCGRSFPYSKMKMQNGLQVCHGPGTTKCADEPGHSAAVKRLNLPFEERPRPLPWEDEDL